MAIEFGQQEDLRLGSSGIAPRDTYVRPAVDPNAGSGMMSLSKALAGFSGTMEDLDKKASDEEAKNNDYYVAKAATGLEMGEIPDPNALTNVWSPKHASNTAKFHEDVMGTQGRDFVTSRVGSIPPDVATDPAAFTEWANAIRAESLAAVDKAGPFSRSYMTGVEAQLSQLQSQVHQVYTSAAVSASDKQLDNSLTDSKNGYYAAGGTAPNPVLANSMIASAQRLKMDPAVYAAIISYKTAGTFDPWFKGKPNKWGTPTGFIQMGDTQRTQYGYKDGGSPDELFGSVEAYLWGNGYKEGMSPEDVYSIINTGAPGNFNLTDTAQGGDSGTVKEKVQNKILKDHYQNALKFFGLTAPRTKAPGSSAIPGTYTVVSSVTGKALPENFKALKPEAQDKVLALAGLFGENLKITPHGGKQPDHRKKTSQHHAGLAADLNIQSYDDAKKSKLVSDAVVSGATGLGSYSVGDGVGTIHVDYRDGKGNDPSGLAIWHRMAGPNGKSVDKGLETAPDWFQKGVADGLARRSGGEKPYQVADASGTVLKGTSPSPLDAAAEPPQGNLRWDVLLYQNALFNNDQTVRLTSVGIVGKERVKDHATEDIIATALDKRDETWLQAMPQDWVDDEVRTKFDEAKAKIAALKKADIAAANSEQERVIRENKAHYGRITNAALLEGKDLTPDQLKELNKVPGGDDIVAEYFTRKEKFAKGMMNPRQQSEAFAKVRSTMRDLVNQGKSPYDADLSEVVDTNLYTKLLDFADKMETDGQTVNDPHFATRWASDRKDFYLNMGVLGAEPNPNMPYIDDAFNTYLEEAVFEFTDRTGRRPVTRSELESIYRTARDNTTMEVVPGKMPAGFIDLPGTGLPPDKSFFKAQDRVDLSGARDALTNTDSEAPAGAADPAAAVSDEVKKKAEELFPD